MFYEICFIRGDLPLGLARDIFLDVSGDLLYRDDRLAGKMTYSVTLDLPDGSQLNFFVNKAKTALDLASCSLGSWISEAVNTDREKRNVKVGLVYYASANYDDILGGDGWCVARPCNANKAKTYNLKQLK